MTHKSQKAILAIGACLTFCGTAAASEFQALCGGVKCTVSITPDLISSPYGQIPPSRVTYWGSSGDSKTSVGTGVATTLLFGGIGLLGFLAKNHQYNFTINGFDAEGKKASMQVEFKNDKPAKQLMSELTSFTGLGMGQTRTAEEILAAENGEQPTLENLGKFKESSILGPKGQKKVEVVKKNCWTTYLDQNPAMKKWAEANPAQASQNKKKFDDC
jgi:hypothetical protein